MNINHVLIRTKNLQTMTQFLTIVTGLKQGHRPPFPFPGAWLYSEGKPLIHLAEANTADTSQKEYLGSNDFDGKGAVDHIALDGSNYEELVARLKNNQINYTERTVPLTHEHQVFISGPDGIKVEMIFSHDKSPLT